MPTARCSQPDRGSRSSPGGVAPLSHSRASVRAGHGARGYGGCAAFGHRRLDGSLRGFVGEVGGVGSSVGAFIGGARGGRRSLPTRGLRVHSHAAGRRRCRAATKGGRGRSRGRRARASSDVTRGPDRAAGPCGISREGNTATCFGNGRRVGAASPGGTRGARRMWGWPGLGSAVGTGQVISQINLRMGPSRPGSIGEGARPARAAAECVACQVGGIPALPVAGERWCC